MPSTSPRLRLLAGLLAALATAAAAARPPLRMLVFPVPGLFDIVEGGHIAGPGGLLLRQIAQASELSIETSSVPLARAWNTVLTEPNTCVLGVTRSPDREERFQWVGVVSRADVAVYGRTDALFAPPDLGALRGKPVVVLRETFTAIALREAGVVAQEVSSAAIALRMLQAGRVDYWYAHQLVAEPTARNAGGLAIRPLLVTSRIDGYLACNPETAADDVDKLRQALQRLRRQGDLTPFGVR
ncbi:substrate-binding periplasmic protein [Roseateles sp. DXS20W]|uniref:Substrate-binding periplasmic protein n=1 Tax=Pelomonas lactea TaxID=3299030 RepID=A0ABW7GRW4_9BURK